MRGGRHDSSPQFTATAHTVRVRTVYQRAGKRGAPVPVPEVRAGGLYHGAPCTAGTKVQLHLYRRYQKYSCTVICVYLQYA